jgi:ataxia telangiectasia mutated family protein
MGIYQYLLQHGKPHLSTRISFIAGLGVSIFASLTGFITSSQDSTTQESHFVATMTNAQAFRAFLGEYLETLKFVDAPVHTMDMFRRIVRHAKSLTGHGNSAQSTSEGSLLLALLEDQSSVTPLLTDIHFDLSLEILCTEFSISEDTRDDILTSDEAAAKASPTLHLAIKNPKLDSTFRSWAAQAIGRGYILLGMRDAHMESPIKHSQLGSVDDHGHSLEPIASYMIIVQSLADLLWKSDYETAGLVEKTLQLISSNLKAGREETTLLPVFDKSMISDLRFTTFACPSIVLQSQFAANVHLPLKSDANASEMAERWASKIMLDLCSEALDDPVLTYLGYLGRVAPTVAALLLPYAVHLVLAGESGHQQPRREHLSKVFSEVIQGKTQEIKSARPLVLNALLYLRKCLVVGETTIAQRNAWLDVNFSDAAVAASQCGMWHEALLFLELHHSQAHLQAGRSSRRSVVVYDSIPLELESAIYEHVDDPDFFYGKHEDSDLQSVIAKLGHERSNNKSLSFQSALLDSQLKMRRDPSLGSSVAATASALIAANMQGISEAVRQYYEGPGKPSTTGAAGDLWSTFDQWDVGPDTCQGAANMGMASIFRSMQDTSNRQSLVIMLDQSLLRIGDAIGTGHLEKAHREKLFSQLAVLAESRQVIGAAAGQSLDSIWANMVERSKTIKHAEYV